MSNRIKILRVAPYMLGELLRPGYYASPARGRVLEPRISGGACPGAKVERIEFHPRSDCWDLTVSREDWPEVPPGDYVPIIAGYGRESLSMETVPAEHDEGQADPGVFRTAEGIPGLWDVRVEFRPSTGGPIAEHASFLDPAGIPLKYLAQMFRRAAESCLFATGSAIEKRLSEIRRGRELAARARVADYTLEGETQPRGILSPVPPPGPPPAAEPKAETWRDRGPLL